MIAAAAPTILEPQPAAAASPVATPPTGFDAILMLQGLAATPDMEVSAFEPGDASDALAGEDGGDDETDDDIEASLAFLANLIAATSPRSGGFEAGAGAGGDVTPGEGDDAAAVLDAEGFALATTFTDTPDSRTDALLALTAVDPEPLDQRQPTGDAAQNLARAAELLAQAPRAADVARSEVTTHVRDPRWADDFSARVSLMIRAGESTASLQLTPVDLGPVEVKVTVKDSQATIHFGASQADTRALIEASLPRLRELLASQGFNLLDASVSSGFSRPQQPATASPNRTSADPEASTPDIQPIRRLGLLDLYA